MGGTLVANKDVPDTFGSQFLGPLGLGAKQATYGQSQDQSATELGKQIMEDADQGVLETTSSALPGRFILKFTRNCREYCLYLFLQALLLYL